MPRLLLIETDRFMQRSLQGLFAAEGYFCVLATSGEESLHALHNGPFDLVVLDFGQLREESLSLLRQIRLSHHTPLLLLGPRYHVIDTVAGLEGGADDYLCEPFDPRELVARVRAQLRRGNEYSSRAGDRKIDLGHIVLDVDRRDAFREGTALNLTTREFELLHLLARHQNKALASSWIVETIWGSAAELGRKALTVSIGRLRGKIEADARHPRLLLSVRRFGYKLVTGNA